MGGKGAGGKFKNLSFCKMNQTPGPLPLTGNKQHTSNYLVDGISDCTFTFRVYMLFTHMNFENLSLHTSFSLTRLMIMTMNHEASSFGKLDSHFSPDKSLSSA